MKHLSPGWFRTLVERAAQGGPNLPGHDGFVALVFRLSLRAVDQARAERPGRPPTADELLALWSARVGEPSRKESADAAFSRIEESLEQRSASLSSDPYYGVLLHQGLVALEDELLGRLAHALWTGRGFDARRNAARRRFAEEKTALLAQLLIGLACVDHRPSFPVRKALSRQVEDLGLPEDLHDGLKRFAERSFSRPMPVGRVLARVKSLPTRQFLMEQVALAVLAGGYQTRLDRAYVLEVAAGLHCSPAALLTIEAEARAYYALHGGLVEAFGDVESGVVVGEEWLDDLKRLLERNMKAFIFEARQTKDLSLLLAKAARGQSLSAVEKRRMRDQLIDVVRVIPALAIFAAPGGVFLLVALAKVLPFEFLPNAFRERHDEDESER